MVVNLMFICVCIIIITNIIIIVLILAQTFMLRFWIRIWCITRCGEMTTRINIIWIQKDLSKESISSKQINHEGFYTKFLNKIMKVKKRFYLGIFPWLLSVIHQIVSNCLYNYKVTQKFKHQFYLEFQKLLKNLWNILYWIWCASINLTL